MRKTVKSWSGNPETEPDCKSEVKSYNIIADISCPKTSTLIEAINKIIDLSEFYYLEDVNFDSGGCTIFATIDIEDPVCCSIGNFDKLKSYFGGIGDIFYEEQENHFKTMSKIFKPE